MKIPDSPPITNIETKEIANNIGVVNWIFPPHIVPSQLNTFTALGSAISIVDTIKVIPSAGFIPEINMWCPHTMNPNPAIPEIAKTIGL